jgi:ubiquinone/menaquinone biosynthesis C-methylase UbiE
LHQSRQTSFVVAERMMMANEFRTLDAHSAEYFGDTRDHWWNLDFLELIGKRLSLDRANDVLDVGSGVGHWGQLLANVIPRSARVQGVDRDPLWVEKAAARAAACGLAARFTYQVAVAEKLPFADASFDLVTCQTVLIHLPDPRAAVDEMLRVARPGGLILAAEPRLAALNYWRSRRGSRPIILAASVGRAGAELYVR